MRNLVAVLIAVCFLHFSKCQSDIVIAPMGNCTINDTVCYSIEELLSGQVLSSLNYASVSVTFLSGTHVIPDNSTLKIF